MDFFSKADVKGKGKSQEVSWACDETSSQADQGSPHAHPHSLHHSKHFKLAAIVGDGDDTIDNDASSMLGATSATSTTAPSMTGLGYNPSILEGLGVLLVDALQQPQVSMANNEAGPSTRPYAGLNPTSGLEMWSMTDAEFQSLLNASAHVSWYDLPLSFLIFVCAPPHLRHLPTPSNLVHLPSTASAPTSRCTHATMLCLHLD